MEAAEGTIVLPPDLHAFLAARARLERRSVAELVREACARQYGYVSEEDPASVSREDRIRAAEELVAMNLPVGTVEEMKRESIRFPNEPPA